MDQPPVRIPGHSRTKTPRRVRFQPRAAVRAIGRALPWRTLPLVVGLLTTALLLLFPARRLPEGELSQGSTLVDRTCIESRDIYWRWTPEVTLSMSGGQLAAESALIDWPRVVAEIAAVMATASGLHLLLRCRGPQSLVAEPPSISIGP